jgi:hypothetical protein
MRVVTNRRARTVNESQSIDETDRSTTAPIQLPAVIIRACQPRLNSRLLILTAPAGYVYRAINATTLECTDLPQTTLDSSTYFAMLPGTEACPQVGEISADPAARVACDAPV